MSTETASGEIRLAARGTLALRDADGVRVEVLRGRVWITTQGMLGDIWLDGPGRHVVAGDGLTVIEATSDAVVDVGAQPATRRNPEWPAARARLPDWTPPGAGSLGERT